MAVCSPLIDTQEPGNGNADFAQIKHGVNGRHKGEMAHIVDSNRRRLNPPRVEQALAPGANSGADGVNQAVPSKNAALA